MGERQGKVSREKEGRHAEKTNKAHVEEIYRFRDERPSSKRERPREREREREERVNARGNDNEND